MEELSLYILDIAMNSVRAGADNISIELIEDESWLYFTVIDDGCGMTTEQVNKLSDPFFTTRKTRKVGLGIPFLKMLAEMTDGSVEIHSVHESVSSEHGTKITAKFGKNHIDFIPLGNIIETIKTLIQGSPEIDFEFMHKINNDKVSLSCKEIRKVLGNISLSEPEILSWIGENLIEQYNQL